MCWKCGTPIEADAPLGRDALCPVCSAYLRSCKNCVFFEPGAHYDCRETVDDPVSDKEAANFCGFFSLRRTFDAAAAVKHTADRQNARDAFARLFSD